MEMVYRLLVEDKPGVLDRIAGMVRRHGANISFLLVFETETPGISLMTFKLVGGCVNSSVTKRLSEFDCIISLEHVEDNITARIMEDVK